MPRDRYNDADHLNPGLLRHRVTIYSPTYTKSDETGEDVTTYTEVFANRIAAAMNPTGGRKVFDAARFNAENFETCMLRYRRGINTTMQLEFDGVRFEIIDWDDVNERKIKLMLALRRIEPALSSVRLIDDVLVIDNVTDMDTLQETT